MLFPWFRKRGKTITVKPSPKQGSWSGQSPDQELPVEIIEDNDESTTIFEKGGVGKNIVRLEHDLDVFDIEAHEKIAAIKRANLRDELDGGWARDQQRTSIWLFRLFGISLFSLFHFSLFVMLTTPNAAHEHLASVVMEMILASVVAGFLGYLLAKPFEHRR